MPRDRAKAAHMRIDPARASALIAVFTALAIPLPAAASQDTGGASPERPPLQGSGGVAGPAVEDGARSSQTPAPAPLPAQEEGPQIEEPPPEDTEDIPDEETGPDTRTEDPPADDDGANAPAAAAPSGGGGGGGGLPTTGLEIAALTAVGLGLLLAGVALRRRPA